MKTRRMVERIQMASAVKPFESEGVVKRTEVNMFTSTLVMMKMILIKMRIEELNQQCSKKHAKASRVGSGWYKKTHRGDRNKHP